MQAGLRGAGERRDLLGGQYRVGAERCAELAGGHDRHALGVSEYVPFDIDGRRRAAGGAYRDPAADASAADADQCGTRGLPRHSPPARSLGLTRDRDARVTEAPLGLGVALPHPLELGLEHLEALLQLGQAVPAAVLAPAAAPGLRPVLVAADAPEQLLRVDAERARQRDQRLVLGVGHQPGAVVVAAEPAALQGGAGKSTGSVTRRCRRSAPTQLAPGTPPVEAEAKLGQAEMTGPPPRPEATVAVWM